MTIRTEVVDDKACYDDTYVHTSQNVEESIGDV